MIYKITTDILFKQDFWFSYLKGKTAEKGRGRARKSEKYWTSCADLLLKCFQKLMNHVETGNLELYLCLPHVTWIYVLGGIFRRLPGELAGSCVRISGETWSQVLGYGIRHPKKELNPVCYNAHSTSIYLSFLSVRYH